MNNLNTSNQKHYRPPVFSIYFNFIHNTTEFTSEKEKLFHFFNYLVNNEYAHEASELVDYMITARIIDNPSHSISPGS